MNSFIVIEGPDGVGKSTHSKMLADRLDYRWQCFPDRTTPIGRLLDSYLKGRWRAFENATVLESKVDPFNGLIFQGLQLANRTEHLRRLRNASEKGLPLVLDRYWMSGYAYGKLDGLDPDWLIEVHQNLPPAHLNILIDVPEEISVERLKARGASAERYENVDMIHQIRSNYLELWGKAASIHGSGRWVIVDGNKDKTSVQADIWTVVTGEGLPG